MVLPRWEKLLEWLQEPTGDERSLSLETFTRTSSLFCAITPNPQGLDLRPSTTTGRQEASVSTMSNPSSTPRLPQSMLRLHPSLVYLTLGSQTCLPHAMRNMR